MEGTLWNSSLPVPLTLWDALVLCTSPLPLSQSGTLSQDKTHGSVTFTPFLEGGRGEGGVLIAPPCTTKTLPIQRMSTQISLRLPSLDLSFCCLKSCPVPIVRCVQLAGYFSTKFLHFPRLAAQICYIYNVNAR